MSTGHLRGHHVSERRKILRRLARRHRQTPPQIIHQRTRRAPTRASATGGEPPKNQSGGPTLAEVLRSHYFRPGHSNTQPINQAAKRIIAQAGELNPDQITAPLVAEITDKIRASPLSKNTQHGYLNATRQILHWLTDNFGAPRLGHLVPRTHKPRPRATTITQGERAMLLNAAPPDARLWMLLCADLALRSTTAARIAPHNYDATNRTVTFTTKCGENLTHPVTREISDLIRFCNLEDPRPFVLQLRDKRAPGPEPTNMLRLAERYRVRFRNICKRVGITRRITPHDFRRTAAVNLLHHTKDVRDVQGLLGHVDLASTFWYLDHEMRQIRRETLEALKTPKPEPEERTA